MGLAGFGSVILLTSLIVLSFNVQGGDGDILSQALKSLVGSLGHRGLLSLGFGGRDDDAFLSTVRSNVKYSVLWNLSTKINRANSKFMS